MINNGLGLLFKSILCVATDGKDGNGLKLEKVGPTFSSFDAISFNKKYLKSYYGLYFFKIGNSLLRAFFDAKVDHIEIN